MEKTILFSLPIEDLQTLIIDCVNSCLKHQPQTTADLPFPDQLLTIKQAGEFLNLSVATLYGYVQRAEIPVSKRGKRLYFSRQELTDWVKSGRKKTISEIAVEAENYVHRKR